MPLFILFVAIPLIEIALFVEIGGLIGLWATLLVVVASAVFGVQILRAQGAATTRDLQRALAEFRDPSLPLAHGMLKMLAGMLLIVPGFLTDACGLLLLVPAVRHLVMRRMRGRVAAVTAGGDGSAFGDVPHRYGGGTVIDGEYMEEATPPTDSGRRGPSGWTRPDAH